LYPHHLTGKLYHGASPRLGGNRAGSIFVLRSILSTVPPLRNLIAVTERLEQGETALDIPIAFAGMKSGSWPRR